MRIRNYKIAVLAGGLAAAITISYISFGPILVALASLSSGLDIHYDRIERCTFKEIALSGLKVTDKKRGIGFFARYGSFRPEWSIRSPSHISADFNLRGLHLIKEGPAKNEGEAYDSLGKLVTVPFRGQWTYKDISGNVSTFDKGVHIKNLNAISEDIKLEFNGKVYDDNRIDSEMVIYFSEKLTGNMPKELSEVVLTSEGDGWYSLAVNLTGDYANPSIQISSKLFRLNIKNTAQ